MSLLRETVSTVIQGDDVVVGNAYQTALKNVTNFRGYQVVSGAVEPRDNDSYLFVDNITGEPIQLPVNSIPILSVLIPAVPIENGASPGSSSFDIYFYDDTSFNNSINPWGGNGSFNGDEINSKGVFENTDGSSFVSDFDGYPYIGLESSGTAVTKGTIQIYVYYMVKP